MKIDNVGLAVRELGPMVDFFARRLGVPVERVDASGSAIVQLEGSYLYVFTSDAESGARRAPALEGNPPGLDHISFRVGDVDAAHAELRERGVEFIEGPVSKPEWGLRVAAFVDPERNLYFLIQALES